jgi:Protein of unknown function (DUF3606)
MSYGVPCESRRAVQTVHRPTCFATHRKDFQMPDDLEQTGKPDGARLSVEREHEVRYWAEKLGVAAGEIRPAVKAAGYTFNVVSSVAAWAAGVTILFGAVGCAPRSPTDPGPWKKCHFDYHACMNYCDLLDDGQDGSPRAKCAGQCSLDLLRCKPSPSRASTEPARPA